MLLSCQQQQIFGVRTNKIKDNLPKTLPASRESELYWITKECFTYFSFSSERKVAKEVPLKGERRLKTRRDD